MKSVNFKLEKSRLDKINYYRSTQEAGRVSQADFFISSVLEKCEMIRHQRAGGMVLTVPNPNVDKTTDNEKAKVMSVLDNAIKELQKTDVTVAADCLGELVEFLDFHFYKISDQQKKSFDAKFIVDLEVEAELDRQEDAEFEEMQERAAKAFKDK